METTGQNALALAESCAVSPLYRERRDKILIVDDSPVEIKIIRRLLQDEYEVLEATTGEAALELAAANSPDLILLDIIMPEMDGLTVCRLLKSNPATFGIPIIFITAIADSPHIIKGFEAGGQDYITKPFNSPELCARIKVHLDLKRSRETVLGYAKKMEVKNRELHELLVRLENSAMTDYLTGLENRRSMMQRIKAQTAKMRRHNGKATLIVTDIDDFKKVNDTYGHDGGDFVLKDVAGMMKSLLREEDAIARWGGEEFLILLTDTDMAAGNIVAERLRSMVEKTAFRFLDKPISVTLTLGVAELDCCLGFDASIKKADEALYKGKKFSKNCVVSYPNGYSE